MLDAALDAALEATLEATLDAARLELTAADDATLERLELTATDEEMLDATLERLLLEAGLDTLLDDLLELRLELTEDDAAERLLLEEITELLNELDRLELTLEMDEELPEDGSVPNASVPEIYPVTFDQDVYVAAEELNE